MATITPGDYAHSKTLYIDKSKIAKRLTDYPVRVLLTARNFDFTEPLSTAGGDIIFTTDDGVYTVLDFEEAYYDDTNELAEYHVKIADVSPNINTSFIMFWGRTGQTSQENPTAVWDSNYVAVYHLGGGVDDSTSNNHDGTASGTSVINDDTRGKLRRFNGTSDYITIPHSTDFNLDNYTADYAGISYTGASGTTHMVFEKYLEWYNLVYAADDEAAAKWYLSSTVYEARSEDINIFDTGAIYHFSGRKSASAGIELLINGEIEASDTTTGSTDTSTEVVAIGARYTGGAASLWAKIDLQEVRISSTTRSDAWIRTDYYNLTDQLLTDEKGKIIKVTFDEDLQYSSLEGNEDNFTISADEPKYVPGGPSISQEYTVEEIEIDGIRAIKRDFLYGNFTDIPENPDILLLDSSTYDTPYTVGPTGNSSGNDNGVYYMQFFELTAAKVYVSFQVYSESTGESVTYSLYSMPSDSYDVSADGTEIWTETRTLTGSAYNVFTIEMNLPPGRYAIGKSAGAANDIRYQATWTYPRAGTDVTFLGYNTLGQSTLSTSDYGPALANQFADALYATSGSWTFAIDCDEIDAANISLAEWTETLPAGTDATIYTQVSADGVTVPTSGWTEQTVNGGSIQSLSTDEDLTGKFIWIKIELSTTDTAETPEISAPTFKAIKVDDQKSLRLLIEEWGGFNRASGDIEIDYDGDLGTLAGDAAGHAQVEDFTETFTPTELSPIHNPGILEALEVALTDYSIDRLAVTFIDGFEYEALETALTDYSITRTHVDDLPP